MIHLRARARRDLLNIAGYLEQESGSPTIRRRFLTAALETAKEYERWPRIGAVVEQNEKGSPLRRFTVRDFANYLAFYRETKDGITIVRVLHGARNLPLFWNAK